MAGTELPSAVSSPQANRRSKDKAVVVVVAKNRWFAGNLGGRFEVFVNELTTYYQPRRARSRTERRWESIANAWSSIKLPDNSLLPAI